MVDPKQPISGRDSRRIYVLWAIGFGLLLLLGLACWLVVAPVLRVKTLAAEIARTGTVPSNAVERLGGRKQAAGALTLYFRAPVRWSPHRSEAVCLLSHCGPEMLPALRLALKSKDGSTRSAAVRLAEHIGAAGTPLAPELVELLGDWNASVWLHATKALGATHAPGAKAANVAWRPKTTWRYSYDTRGLILGLNEPPFASFNASDWPPPEPLSADMARRIAAALAVSLGDRDEEVVAAALETLSGLGECAAPVAPGLARLVQAGPENLRVNAAAVLAGIGPSVAEATPALAACLQDPCEDLRVNAVLALAGIVTDRAALAELLKPVAGDASPRVRQAVTDALGEGMERR
ncbi:MAG TPA: HEAT repeat domain-containing protein [Phycisphaerae bacterium]|nr:HEAT repeat domain-containing protein [Phycisphaerae bacterium]